MWWRGRCCVRSSLAAFVSVDSLHPTHAFFLSSQFPLDALVLLAATKEMRTGLFFYVLALHLLVFFTTYHWSAASCHTTVSADLEKLSLIAPHMQQHLIQQKEGAAP